MIVHICVCGPTGWTVRVQGLYQMTWARMLHVYYKLTGTEFGELVRKLQRQ